MATAKPQLPAASAGTAGSGITNYYQAKIDELEVIVRERTQNLRRLEAQRNELNSKVRLLREELSLLQEPGSYVGEIVAIMGRKKVLVKVHPEGKYVVDIDKNIAVEKLNVNDRVALRNDSYTLHLVLPSKVDPLVSLMKVEKVPDSTYDMVGGCDKQIKEIKEVIELPIKHPELFESLGIAQPKGVLMYGPPGTGKTLLARAVAHHTDCTFIRVSGGELVQKYIGEGSRMVRAPRRAQHASMHTHARSSNNPHLTPLYSRALSSPPSASDHTGARALRDGARALPLHHLHGRDRLDRRRAAGRRVRRRLGGAAHHARAAEPARWFRGQQSYQGADGNQPP